MPASRRKKAFARPKKALKTARAGLRRLLREEQGDADTSIACDEEVVGLKGKADGQGLDVDKDTSKKDAVDEAKRIALLEAANKASNYSCDDEDCPDLVLKTKLGKPSKPKCKKVRVKNLAGIEHEEWECHSTCKWTATIECA